MPINDIKQMVKAFKRDHPETKIQQMTDQGPPGIVHTALMTTQEPLDEPLDMKQLYSTMARLREQATDEGPSRQVPPTGGLKTSGLSAEELASIKKDLSAEELAYIQKDLKLTEEEKELLKTSGLASKKEDEDEGININEILNKKIITTNINTDLQELYNYIKTSGKSDEKKLKACYDIEIILTRKLDQLKAKYKNEIVDEVYIGNDKKVETEYYTTLNNRKEFREKVINKYKNIVSPKKTPGKSPGKSPKK
jgi:hypothetical protein